MQKYFTEDGQEIEALPADEAQKIQEERDTLAKEKEELLAEKQRLEEGGKNKDENFVKFRNAYEAKEKQYDEAVKRLNERDEYEKKTVKESLFSHFAGADEESRKKLEEEYGFITGIDESTPENIAKRIEKAARVSGLYKEEGKENPVFKGFWGGQAPNIKPVKKDGDDADDILNTDKGKSALSAMGIPLE